MDYSTMLSQAQITVVIGLLCVLVLKKKKNESGTTWEEKPVNLVSLLCIKILEVALSSQTQ